MEMYLRITMAFVTVVAKHRVDQTDDCFTVWEDSVHVAALSDLSGEAFLRAVRPDLSPDGLRNRGERKSLFRCLLQHTDCCRIAEQKLIDDALCAAPGAPSVLAKRTLPAPMLPPVPGRSWVARSADCA